MRNKKMHHAWILMSMSAIIALVAACQATTDTNGRVDPGTAPSGAAFKPVAQVLVDHCGSLDCHGSKYRNMRLVGFGSTRLDPKDLPDAPDTTEAESDQDYDAVVAVEPELTRQVVAEGGRDPERLTFIRKARGTEAHKGGQPIALGDASDVCLVSWLSGSVDAATCKAAVHRFDNP